MKIAITGGGTGGHTLTAISICNELKAHFDDKISLIYIGSYSGIEKELVSKLPIKYFAISTGKLRRYFSLTNVTDLFRLLKGVYSSFNILRKFRPKVLFSTGGFVSVPSVISASLLGITIIIHEQTVFAGLANRIGGFFAKTIAISFKSSKKYFPKSKVLHTGQPIRKELLGGSKESCYKRFGFKDLPIIYITGGSQGSHKINMILRESLNTLLPNCNVIHQCGKTNNHNDFEELSKYKNSLDFPNRYIVKDFIDIDSLKDILRASSLLIGRSGAGTVHEAIALNLPSVFIPLPSAQGNEQYYNAKVMVDFGGAEIIEETDINSHLLKEKVLFLLKDQITLQRMKKNLSKIHKANANKDILNIIINA